MSQSASQASSSRETSASEKEDHDHGRNAERPTELPKSAWKDILWRLRRQISEDNLSIVAAGVAFYGFVAAVPALAATVAIYGLVADPAQIQGHVTSLARFLPPDVLSVFEQQLMRLAADEAAAGWSAIIGVALALFSSTRGAKALIKGLNIAYDEEEKRNFLKLGFVALTITFLGVASVLVLIGLIAVLPAAVAFAGLDGESGTLMKVLRWPLVLGLFMLTLSSVYRFGPSRDAAQWKWVSWGAAAATAFWLLGSAAFSLYVSNFGRFNTTYGSLGAIVVLLLWLHLTSFVVLLGAEMNAEMERQTHKDTTDGASKPLGQRGAYAADSVGAAHPGKDAGKAAQAEDTESHRPRRP